MNRYLSIRGLALLSALAFAPHPVFAAGAVLMTGKADWKIEKVSAPPGREGNAYCAMTRKFNKDVIFTLGSKADGELSLAFDFQKPLFNPKKDYVVALTSGADAKRAFEARPVSPAALVLSAGMDKTLLGSLEKNGKFEVSLDGNIYVFNLGPFSAGRKKLTDCIASLPDSASAATLASASSERGSRKEVSAAAAQTKSLNAEALLHAGPESTKVEQYSADEAPPQEISRAVSAGKGEHADIAALREENLRLSNALERERRDYENSQMAGSQSNLVSELKEKIALLESGKGAPSGTAKANAAEVSSSDSAQKLKDAAARLDALSVENKRLRSELERLRTESESMAANIVTPKAFDEIKAQLESLKQENDSLKTQITQNQASADEADQVADMNSITRIKTLEIKLDEASKKVADLEKENNSLRAEKEQKLLKVSSDNWNLEEATRRYNEAEREIRRMASLVDENQSQCSQEKAKLEGMLFDPSVTNQEQIAHLGELENKLRTAQSDLQTQRASYDKQMEELRRANAEMDPSQVAKRDEKIGALEAEIKSIRADLEKTIQDRDAERQKSSGLMKEIDGLKGQLDSKSGAAQQAISSAEKEKSGLISELEQTKGSLARIEAEKKVTQAEIARLQAQAETLQAALDSRKDEKQASVALDKTSQAEKAALGRELMSLRAEIVRKDTEYNQKIDRLEAEKSQLAAAFAQSQAQTKVAAAAPRIVSTPAAPVDRVSPSLAGEIESLRAELRKTQQSHEQEISSLRSEIASKDAAIAQASAAKNSNNGAISPDMAQDMAGNMASMEPAAGPGAAAPMALNNASPSSRSADIQTASLPVPSSVQAQPIPAPAVAATQSSPFLNLAQMSGLLENAGIRLSKPVEKVAEVSSADFAAFRWQTGPAFGSAEQRPIRNVSEFGAYVDTYISKTKARCQGDFAASPTVTQGQGADQVSSYEIACVGGDAASSAAVVFFVRNNLFTVIAHEAGTDAMDVAMEDRDRILSVLSSGAAAATFAAR